MKCPGGTLSRDLAVHSIGWFANTIGEQDKGIDQNRFPSGQSSSEGAYPFRVVARANRSISFYFLATETCI